jgi:hypothetical protein
MRKLLNLFVLILLSGSAFAGSTINPAVPAANSPLASAPLRSNFAAAYSDISNLLSQYAGATAPPSPSRYQYWLDTSTNPATLKIYDGVSWVQTAQLNTATHAWTPLGSYAGTPIATAYGGTGADLHTATGAVSMSAGVTSVGTLPSSYLAAPLTSLAVFNTNGLMTQTATNTFTGRTLTGTGAEITVTNGNGVAGNPTLSLPSALTFTGKTITGGTFASPTLTTPVIGAATGTSLSVSGTITAANYSASTANVVSAGGVTTLNVTSPRTQILTGTLNQTFQMPSALSVTTGYTVEFNNNSSGILTVQDFLGGAITTIPSGGYARVIALATGSSAGTWDYHYLIPANGSWGTAGLTNVTLVNPALGTPASGVATNLTGTAASLTAGHVTTNANLTGPITSTGNATSIASQTGTGTKFVMDTSPTLVTPELGVATATSINGNTITTGTGTLTIAAGKTLTASNTLTFVGTDGTSMTFPSTTAVIARTDASQTFTGGITTTGAVTFGTAAGNGSVTVGGSPTNDSSAQIRLIPSNVSTNWNIASNAFTTGALEFVPSTATGGSTFTTPTVKILPSAVTVTGSINATTTGTLPLYNVSGTGQNAPHAVIGSATLSGGTVTVTLSGSSVFSSSSSYVCHSNDTAGSAILSSTQNQSSSSFKIFGTGTDTIAYMCIGN